MVNPIRIENPIEINEDSRDNLIERAKILVSTAKRVPKYKETKKNGFPSIQNMASSSYTGSQSITDYCYLAGFPESTMKRSSKSEYQQIFQYRSKLYHQDPEKRISPLTSTSPSFFQREFCPPPPLPTVGIIHTTSNNIIQPTLSPLAEGAIEIQLGLRQEDSIELDLASDDTRGLISPSGGGPSVVSNLTDGFSREEYQPTRFSTNTNISTSSSSNGNNNSSSVGDVSTSVSTNLASFVSSTKSNQSNQTFSNKVNDKAIRQTSKQANRERHDDEAWKLTKECAYEIATKMYDRVKNNLLPLKKFQTSESIAVFINEGFECELIDGHMIRVAHAKGYIGKAPAKVGRKPSVPENITELLSNLLFTANSIEQNNADSKRMDRQTQISTIAKIVNTKLEADGKAPIIDTTTYFLRHIEKKLTRASAVRSIDKRELLRLKWLTYEQQKMHYVNWELYLVEMGFARRSETKEEFDEGNLVFFPGSLDRMIHIDEMGFSYDGSKNGVGGRVPTYYSNPLVPEAGMAVAKSSMKISVLFGATYSNKPIPPMIIIPSKAKNPRIETDLLLHLHQIKGTFGYKDERAFNCVIGKSK